VAYKYYSANPLKTSTTVFTAVLVPFVTVAIAVFNVEFVVVVFVFAVLLV
jgi:hypothetical protein